MNPVVLMIALLLSVAFWRHVASAMVAGLIVLAVLGVVFLVEATQSGAPLGLAARS